MCVCKVRGEGKGEEGKKEKQTEMDVVGQKLTCACACKAQGGWVSRWVSWGLNATHGNKASCTQMSTHTQQIR